jgi:hypothetical protein
MDVSISITPTVINLGETVTVTYSCTGALNTQILADNMAGVPMDLGSGDQSGTIKFLPIWNGGFNVVITGSGIANRDSESMVSCQSAIAYCKVN